MVNYPYFLFSPYANHFAGNPAWKNQTMSYNNLDDLTMLTNQDVNQIYKED